MRKPLLFIGSLFLLFTFTNVTARAQRRVSGTVINARTRRPVEGANVTFGDNHRTTTDANGQFSIPCSDSVHIAISYIGFSTYETTVENCSQSLSIELTPLTYRLEGLEVEDNAYVNEANAVAHISAQELNRQSGLKLSDALNTIPGIRMQSRTPWGGQRITIRGYYPNTGLDINFNGHGYQLSLNNIPITDATGTTIMDGIDFSNLGSVNVIKGPSPLYGNSIAGTVNLYTRWPQQSGITLREQLVAGSNGLFRNNSSFMAQNGKLGLVINYGNQSFDGIRPNSASKKDYVSVAGRYQVSDKQIISTYFSYNHSDEEIAGGILKEDLYAGNIISRPDYLANNSGVEINGVRLGVTSLRKFNNHFANKTTVFATGHKLNQNFAHGFNHNNSLNFGARTSFTFQQQFKKIGVDGQLGAYVQRSYESTDGVFIPPFIHPPFPPEPPLQFPSNTQNYALNYNVFTKWSFALPHEFQVTVGGILNFNKFGIRDMLYNGHLYSGSKKKSHSFDPTFSPSASILKSFNKNVSVYASVNTGVTPPLLGDIIASDGSINYDLKPESAVQYEIGTKGHLLDGRFTYQLALFSLNISDRLVTQHKNAVSFTTNVGEQQNKGLEFTTSYNIIRNNEKPISLMNVWLSYTYSDFTYDQFKLYAANTAGNDSTIADYSGNPVAGVAPQMFNIGVDLETHPGFYLHSQFKYIDKVPFTFDNNSFMKAYSLLSARIGFKKTFSHLTLNAYAGGNNLTGSTYYNFIFVGESISDLSDGYLTPAPVDPTFYGGVTVKYTL